MKQRTSDILAVAFVFLVIALGLVVVGMTSTWMLGLW
jgi:hypothetical protein